LSPAAQRRVVDSHMHIWPEALAGREFPWPPEPNPHPIEDLLPILDDAGVAEAVQVTPSTLGFDNSYGLAVAERMPDRIAVFGRLDPTAPDPRERLIAWMAHPAALGVRLMLSGARLTVDGDFLAAAEEMGIPLTVFAPGSLAGLVEVAHRYPQLHLVVDHLGLDVYGPEPYRDQPLLAELVGPSNVRVKISGLVETSSEPFPFRDVHDHLARAVELFGAERLIWGSNYPVVLNRCSYAESLRWLDACRDIVSDGDLDAILAGTFDSLVSERVA
jgi:predicted TIM-barrel fold metal-dependent hydrolase